MFTMIRVAKLATDNIGIIFIKTIITDCAPGIVITKFNTSFILNRTSNQSDIIRWTNYSSIVVMISTEKTTGNDLPTHVTPASEE